MLSSYLGTTEIGDVTIISDNNGKILSVSQAYLDFTGYTREEVIGKNHSIFRNTTLDQAVINNLWDTIKQDKVWIGELKNNKSNFVSSMSML